MLKPRMALDFDEVVVWSLGVASDTLLRTRGYPLPDHVYRYTDWVNPPLTEEEYRRAIFHDITHIEWVERIELIPGALEGVRELLACGLEIGILTARGLYEGELEAVEHVLRRYALDLPIVGTAYQPKGNFLTGQVVALDDQVHELVTMPPEMHRLLFSRPHNQAAWQSVSDGIIPVRDWSHAVETIRYLLGL